MERHLWNVGKETYRSGCVPTEDTQRGGSCSGMIVLDTNVVIFFIKKDPDIVGWMNKQRLKGERFCISTITVVELLGFRNISDEEIFLIESWLQYVLVLDVDLSIAREAARIRREMKLTASDSVIVATAVLLKVPVATRDITFKKIRDIEVLVP